MTLKTVQVTGTLYNPDGTPAVNAKGTARLTHYETDNGIVVPSVVDIATAEDGTFAIELWPNARGQAGSQYRIEARVGRTLLLNVLATVPDVDAPVALEDIINQAPYPPVDQAQQAVALAQAAAVEAKGYREDTAAQTKIYDTEELGRAAVGDGQAFKVRGSGDVVVREYLRVDANTSTLEAEYPSVERLRDVSEEMEFTRNALMVVLYGDGPYPVFHDFFIGPYK